MGATEVLLASAGEHFLTGNPRNSWRTLQRAWAHRLIRTAGREEPEYDAWGKPKGRNGEYLSITHSGDLAGVSFASSETGVDLEPVSSKALRVASKFLAKEEMKWAGEMHMATLCWTIKEAVFKQQGKKNIIFNKDIIIRNIDLKNTKAKVFLVPASCEINLGFCFLNNHVLTWTIS